jgi:hypothetical protein
LDSSAARGLRVIEFFDQLVIHNADLEAVTRATAVLAETSAGAVLDQSGDAVVVAPDGEVLATAGPNSHALIQDILVDAKVVGRVWLERPAPEDEREWDRLIVERMAQCLATLSARHASSRHSAELGFTDPAVVHVLLRADTLETETARAARLLGFPVGEGVRVVALHAQQELDSTVASIRRHLTLDLGARSVAAALSSSLAVAIVAAKDVQPFKVDNAAVCVGPYVRVEECHSSWAAARRGVRFAALGGRWPSFVTSDELGCLTVLADIPAAVVRKLPDVEAVVRLAAGKIGGSDIALLDGLGSFSSLREIADALHMHHSSVAYRLGHICDFLGYDVRTQDGRYRARTALTLWRLHIADSESF